jgi:hypothetical protein
VSSRAKLIAGTAVVAVLAAGGAAFAAVKLTTTSSTTTVTAETAAFGDGVRSYGLGDGRLGGRGFGGGLGPSPEAAGPGFGLRRFLGPGLAAAATYLGVSAAQLQSELQNGQTLDQIAKGQGKSLDGLVAAMVAQLKKGLDTAVSNGLITQAQANRLASRLEARLKDMANGIRQPKGFGLEGPPAGGGTATFGSNA